MPAPLPPNSMLACMADIPFCEIYFGKTPLPSYEGKHISTLKSGGRGGRIAIRHLGIYSIRLAKFLPSTSDSCNSLMQSQGASRWAAAAPGGRRGAPRCAAAAQRRRLGRNASQRALRQRAQKRERQHNVVTVEPR